MDYETTVQSVLDYIDKRIKDIIRADDLAGFVGYSTFHFSRIFKDLTGIPLMTYVTYRKFDYAHYDLSCGKQVYDVALDYGWNTHAGFTKAFAKHFGFLPSECSSMAAVKPPEKPTIDREKSTTKGIIK